MATGTNYNYGVWLNDQQTWAVLPDRMKKPTWHNTDIRAATKHAADLQDKGVSCGVREIPAKKLEEFRADFIKVYK